MKEKVLITGASGFVGYHLINAALEQGFDVHAAVRPSSKIEHLKTLPLTFTFSDLGSVSELEKDFREKQYRYIIHAAGATRANTWKEYETVNAGYTRNLASAAQNSGIDLKKFLLVSSLAAMGPIVDLGEEQNPGPVTSYGKSKLLAEHHLAEFDLPSIVVRPTAVYGPREKDIFLMLKYISQGFEIYIGRRDQKLSFIHVTDLADAIMTLLLSSHTKKSYNLTDGTRYDRYAFGNIAKAVLGKRTLKVHLPLRVVKVAATVLESIYGLSGKSPTLNREKIIELTARNWSYDIEDIKKDIGFSPSFDLEKGLRQTLHWYQTNNWI